GARKGLADTALRTADSGYLTRRLVDVSQDVIIREDDCGTEEYIEMAVYKSDGTPNDGLVGRIAARPIETKRHRMLTEQGTEIGREELVDIEQTFRDEHEKGVTVSVPVRSVLKCEAPSGVCQACYGRAMATGALAQIGDAVGIVAAQSIGEPGTQLTMRTFHYGGTASRVSEQSKHIAKNPGIVKFLNVNTVESRRGSLIVINRSGKLVITDEKGRERERYALTYGSQLLVHEADEIQPGTELVTWDPFTSAILSEIGGKVEFHDIVEGENVREETDKVTGLSQKIIVEASANEKRVPAILIHGDDGREKRYLLPSGSHLVVPNGVDVFAGDTLVKIPRETTKTKDITGGLPRVVELFEARSPKEPAIITEIDGVVRLGDVHKGMRKVVVESELGDSREYLVPRSIHINVQESERVRAGDPLIDGAINPHDILQVLGEKELQRYLTDKIQEVYRSQSVAINDKHIEVIVRQMMRSVKIEEVGDTEFLIDEQVDRWKFQEENERVVAAGGTPAIGRPLLLGITKASLSTDSFISAASFQETTRVLTEAAISGKVDGLRGLKENVIVGRVIPAGTGMDHYHNFHMAEEFVESEPETEEELFFEFGDEEIRSLPQEVLESE
ncbi:MAG TPA: DNA-directed RNA polymerase subunit beta', partial [Thermoanaerobaculia bacterium]|nr:DNA-directed RNA polymerase subunit beta' [Thermoanaerobaculia bacterium]